MAVPACAGLCGIGGVFDRDTGEVRDLANGVDGRACHKVTHAGHALPICKARDHAYWQVHMVKDPPVTILHVHMVASNYTAFLSIMIGI